LLPQPMAAIAVIDAQPSLAKLYHLC